MKPFRLLAQALFVSAALISAQAQSANTNTVILGQWDFNTAQLETATVGSPLQFTTNFTPTFSTQQVGENLSGVMFVPAFTSAQRILATFAPTNNGGGTNLNQYTLIMDVMYPAESEATWRALFNTDKSNTTQADMFVDPDGRIGIINDYVGSLAVGEWYRLAFVVDTTTNIQRFVNGTPLANLELPNNSLNGRFSLSEGILFFSDGFGDTAPGFVNLIQLRAGAMSTAEVAAFGGAGSSLTGTAGEVRITNIQRDATPEPDEVVLTVNNNGRTVQLQRSPTIEPAEWTNVGQPTTASTLRAPITGSTGFFRVQVL